MGLGEAGCELTVRRNDGTEKAYGITRSDPGSRGKQHVWKLIDVIRHGGEVDCTAEHAMLHTRVIAKVHELIEEAHVFPAEQVRLDDGMYWVPGLADTLKRCWEQQTLPVL